jgi:hypothetical protein
VKLEKQTLLLVVCYFYYMLEITPLSTLYRSLKLMFFMQTLICTICIIYRIILGKVPTKDGSRNAYTFISGRTLSKGQRGEVYEINGDQVAVIFDPLAEKLHDGDNDATSKEENTEASIYWVDSQDIVHDHDTESEDWHIAIEALCEVIYQTMY